MKKFLIALIMWSLLFAYPLRVLSISQGELNAAQAQYNTQQQQLEAMKKEAQTTKQEILSLTGQAEALDAQLSQIVSQLETAQQQAAEARNLAEQMALNLQAVEADYADCYRRSKEQLAAMQELHDRGSIAVLERAESLYQLLTFGEILQEISQKDTQLLETLSRKAEELEQQRLLAEESAQHAEEAAAQLESVQTQLNTLAETLGQAILENSQLLTRQEAEAQAQEAVTAQAKQAYLEALAQMDAYASQKGQQYTGSTLHCSLDFRCPLNGGYYISCTYNTPDYKGIPHHGTDLAAGNGTPIYAVADGIVSAADSVRSYGNCVQISHGIADDGCRYDSLYAHMSSYCVTEGQAVAKGQVIGYVGNTGDVVGKNGGYHLHLELRVNGNRVNPQGYIPV